VTVDPDPGPRALTSLTRFSDQLNREPTKLLFGDRRKGYDPNDKK